MENKKYAIVRVDYQDCPIKYMVPKKHRKIKCMPFKCDKCRLHGDTKEQMIKKIAQILFQESPHNVLYTNPDKVVNEFFTMTV